MELALAGNPNVGKSVLFTRLTGVGVITANYPGTTVEYYEGKVKFLGMTITVVDLPGTYSLAGNTEDERVATDLLYDRNPHTVIAVLDATRLERNLTFLFELIESGHNVVVALNMYDALRKMRSAIDIEPLERILQVPVVPTVATKGEGIDTLLYTAVQMRRRSNFKVRYDSHIEAMISELSQMAEEEDWRPIPLRAVALRLLSGDPRIMSKASSEMAKRAELLREQFKAKHGEDVVVHILRDKFGEAGRVAREVLVPAAKARKGARLGSDPTLTPLTGIPILIAVLAGLFFVLVYGGGAIEGVLVGAYEDAVRGFVEDLEAGASSQVLKGVIEGVYLSIDAMLALVIPYIFVFYVFLSVLEDSGYIVRVALLMDRVMHRLGLHGRAVLPLMVGLGCNVPAVLATRVMGSRRERLILAALITMAVPCSAQTAIIMGSVGKYAGAVWALAIYVILAALLFGIGIILHKSIGFEPTGLIVEVPDIRMPSGKQTAIKTYVRIKEFLMIAFPLLLVGSIILEVLLSAGALEGFVKLAGPFTTTVLGLPAVVSIALLFGLLRKEMALQMLMVLFGTTNLAIALSPEQMFVYALVMAVFMPCLATIAVLVKEFGVRSTILLSIASISLAIALGAVAKLLLGA